MSNIIQADFGRGILPNEDRFIEELQPLLDDMTDVACDNLGEELGFLLIQSLCVSLGKIAENLSEQLENKKNYILTMENGDIIDLDLEKKDSE